MGNFKIKYTQTDSSESIELTITLPFLPHVGHEIILEDKTVLKVTKISHCVKEQIAVIKCEDTTKRKNTSKQIRIN